MVLIVVCQSLHEKATSRARLLATCHHLRWKKILPASCAVTQEALSIYPPYRTSTQTIQTSALPPTIILLLINIFKLDHCRVLSTTHAISRLLQASPNHHQATSRLVLCLSQVNHQDKSLDSKVRIYRRRSYSEQCLEKHGSTCSPCS